MAYSRFTLNEARTQFQLEFNTTQNLFPSVAKVKIGDFLAQTLERNVPLAPAINTEKARSEMIIAPILVEFRELADPPISLFSGVTFNVDRKQGLTGPCDFIICRSPDQLFITAPVIAIAEAKNENINRGMGSVPLRCMWYNCSTNARATAFRPSTGLSQQATIGNF